MEIPMQTANVALRVGGKRVAFGFDVPTIPVEPVALLPLFRSITDTLVDIAAEETRARGLSISCRKGCGACCRQLVPISEMEATAIRRLVASLPEPRRSTVVERFVRGVARLREAGLLETLRHPESVDAEKAEQVGLDYFAQGVACPFLEDESCSIHPERPLACREYLVTSPASNCTHPSSNRVQCVPVPAKPSRAVRRIGDERAPDFEPWIPMILALDWPVAERSPQNGTTMVARAFAHLTGADIPTPDR
jgi:Fe-S-cluster containining protein